MILTSSGSVYVYGFFIADGAECHDLHSLHASAELAEQAVKAWKRSERFWPSEILTVEAVEVQGELQVAPPDAKEP